MRSLDQIGEREIRATTAIAARFGDGLNQRLAEADADESPLAGHVLAIRDLMGALVQVRGRSGAPDRKQVAEQLARSEDEIRALAYALGEDRGRLTAETALLAQQERVIDSQVRRLHDYDELLSRVDGLVSERIRSFAATDGAKARLIEKEAKLPVRQRRRDVLMHLAVATQAQLTLHTLVERNTEVIRALHAAETTTLTALRTAGLAMSGGVGSWADALTALDQLEDRWTR